MEVEKSEKKTLQNVFDAMEYDFCKMLDSQNISFSQEAHFAMQALLNNDYLMTVAKNNPLSLRNAVLNISATGLSLNPVSQLAYLVPRTVNKKPQVCLDISYKGLIRVATESGSIEWAQADVVYQNDTFEMHEAGKQPTHTYNPFSDRGGKVGAYVIAKTSKGDFLTTVMSIEEIYEIRNASEAFKKGFGPWRSFENEMIKKTVVKRAAKMWPRTTHIFKLEKAIDVVNEHEGIEFESEQKQLERDFPIPPEEKEPGPLYRVQNGKFRGRQLKDIDPEELRGYVETLDKREFSTGLKEWEYNLRDVLVDYLVELEAPSEDI